MSFVSNVEEAAARTEALVNSAARETIGEINSALTIAQNAIRISAGDSAISGAKNIFKEADSAAHKRLDISIKAAKDELSRSTKSAKDTCTDCEKVSVTEAIKVADARLDAAVKLANAEIAQASKNAQEQLNTNVTCAKESEKAYETVIDGAKKYQKKFDDHAHDALNIVKDAAKNVRDAKTPGEALDAKLICKDAHTKAYQKLDDASLQIQRDMDDVTSKAAAKYADVNVKGDANSNLAALNEANQQAFAAIQASHAQWKAKIDQEASIAMM